jgi:tetratricopeptide (TPR) repeat protein
VENYLKHEKTGFFGELDVIDNTMGDWTNCWWICFRNLLVFLPYPENYYLRLVNELKSYYSESEDRLRVIEEFEHSYNPQRAIWWYTRSTFLFDTLNRAFRRCNIRLLLLFGFWIQDLYRALHCEYQKYKTVQLQPGSTVTVYRGQVMSSEERETFENREPFVVNSPFSTSLDREVASFFLESCEISDELNRVLFEIEVDPDFQSVPFGDISQVSSYPAEGEILFMAGTHFQYTGDGVRCDKNGNWLVKLKLIDNFEIKDNRYFDCTTQRSTLKRCITELINNRNLPTLETVNTVFDELVSIYPAEEKWISAIKFYCGASNAYIMRSSKSRHLVLPYYEKAYEIWLTYLNDDDLNCSIDIAQILVASALHLKDTNRCKQHLRRAISFYLRGIKRRKTGNVYELIQNLDSLVETYEMKIKSMKDDDDDDDEKERDGSKAIKWQKLHIQLMLKYPHFLGLMTIGFYITRIANIYKLIRKYDDALFFYQKALDSVRQEGVDLHTIIDIYTSIVTIFTCHKQDLDLALQYELIRHEYTLEVSTSESGDPVYQVQNKKTRIVKSHLSVADVSMKGCNYYLADQHLNIALKLQLELKQIREQQRDRYDDPSLWNVFNDQCKEYETDITATKEKLKFIQPLLK